MKTKREEREQRTLSEFVPTVKMYFPADKKESEREVSGEGPQVMTPETVRYWCRHTRELKGSQVTKAEQFVKFDCLHYLGNGRFVCLPLNTKETVRLGDRVLHKLAFDRDYNSSEYLITKEGKTFRCNCQGWATKEKRGELVSEGANCSHVLGLFYAFKLKKWKEQELSVEWNTPIELI